MLEMLIDRLKNNTKTNLYTNLVQCSLYSASVLYAKYLQGLAMNHLRDYDILQGHLANFGFSGLVTSAAMVLDSRNTRGNWRVPFAAGTLNTLLYEVITPIMHRVAVSPADAFFSTDFSKGDIAAYYLGAYTAFGVSEFFNSQKVTGFIYRTKERILQWKKSSPDS